MSPLVVLQGCRTLQLTRGQNTLIDEADFERVGSFNWHVRPKRDGGFYAVRNATVGIKKQRSAWLHRVLLDAPPGRFILVDHRNRDSLDNRRTNLRLATPSQNTQNMKSLRGASRFKGVYTAGRWWRARLRIGGRNLNLGCHRSEEAAARAYDHAAREHFGEFACTNADIFGAY